MKRIWRLSLDALILISCTGCDQATKNIARELLASSPPISLLNGLVRFEYTENPGAFLGLGSNLPGEGRFLLFVIFASVSLLLTLAFITRAHNLDPKLLIGLSLVAGGGIGNLLDRIFNDGAVIDFVRLGVGPFRTGIFNLADVAIVGGVVILFLWSARDREKGQEIPPDGIAGSKHRPMQNSEQ